jgi:hypothetical protein
VNVLLITHGSTRKLPSFFHRLTAGPFYEF